MKHRTHAVYSAANDSLWAHNVAGAAMAGARGDGGAGAGEGEGAAAGEVEGLCPVCQEEYDTDLAVMPCGHMVRARSASHLTVC